LGRAWRYVVLGATSIVFEETNPIWGGIAVRRGRLEMFWVIVAVTLGTWAASVALYALGRWRIDWVRRRWPQHHRLLDSALALVGRNPWLASLSIRFGYGLRLPLPIACGAARLSFSLYLLASGISCLVWSGLFAYVGLALGRAALKVLSFTHRLDVRLSVAAVLLLIVLSIVTRRRLMAERNARTPRAEKPVSQTSAS
jgi:membrane protein DedA with SNARE-associated domain